MTRTNVYCAYCHVEGEPFGTIKVGNYYEEVAMFGTCNKCYKILENASKECFECSQHRRLYTQFDKPLRMNNGDPTWICGETHVKAKYCKTCVEVTA